MTPGGTSPEGKDLIKKLTSLQHTSTTRSASIGSPSLPGTTHMASVHKLLSQSFFFF
jgi:hypothetical protein